MDLSHTIQPKSDQLNADDLITGPRIIKITDVTATDGDQPISVSFEGDNGKPYKPCKSMRRVMIFIWGKHSKDWIGQSVELYRDPDVKFGGQAVGGIRIARATGIEKTTEIVLTVTRTKRAPYKIEPLKISNYPDDKLEKDMPKIKSAIETGKSTHEKIIAHLEKTAPLTQDQKDKIFSIQVNETDETDMVF